MRQVVLAVLGGLGLAAGPAFAGGAEVFDFNKAVANADRDREAINRFLVRASDYTVSAVVVNKEIPLHQHDDGSHVLYIVSGRGTATLDGQPVTLKPGNDPLRPLSQLPA